MNNFDYQMFLNGTNDGFSDIFLQGNTSSSNIPMFNNGMNNNTNNLFTPSEGYLKGNMFKNLYDPFMNYMPIKPVINDAREEALFNLGQVHFAMHEANLYLDNFPNDKVMLNKFNEWRKTYEQMLNDYQSKYGPLEITGSYMTNTPFAWSNNAFPWNGGNR